MAAPDAPIRAAFCHYTSDVCGGSDKSLFDLVTRFPRNRITPIVVLKRGDPLAAAYRAVGLEVHEVRLVAPRRALEPRKLARFFLAFWPAVFRLLLLFRRLRVDVVHVNTANNLQAPVAAKLAGLPLVWHVRELVPDSRAAALVRGLVTRLAWRVVAISAAVAESFPGARRVRIVPNGIDLDGFPRTGSGAAIRAELGIPALVPVVTTIGRLEPWKGQHVFVEAIALVRAAYPEAHFLLVGGAAVNKPAYAPALARRVEELGATEQVHFTGIRTDIPELLDASTVLVLPSATPEPFGRTVVEAMAAERPVVATRAGGPVEIVAPGETGLLAEPGDAASLAACICEILGDPERARIMGLRGRERAVARYSVERVVREMTDLLLEVYTEARG